MWADNQLAQLERMKPLSMDAGSFWEVFVRVERHVLQSLVTDALRRSSTCLGRHLSTCYSHCAPSAWGTLGTVDRTKGQLVVGIPGTSLP